MAKFLDDSGLQVLWGLIKGGFVKRSSVSEKSTSLTWDTETEIANIDGKSIKVKIPAAPTFSNTARLQVSDTTNRRINTKESTGNYIQFTGGTNKFIVGDGTSSFDVSVTPSISLAHTITVKSGVKSDGSTEITSTSPSADNPTVSLGDSGVSAGIYGPSADVSGSNGNTIKVPQIRVNAKGIVTEISEKTFTAVNSTYTVNNAALSLQVNGASKTTFYANDSTNKTFNIASGTSSSGNGTFLAGGEAVSIYGLDSGAYKAVDAESMTASSTNLPTSKAVAAFVSAALTSVLSYKGTIGSSGATVTSLPASHKVGDTYVVSTAGTYAGKACEVGDYIICRTAGSSANDSHWDVINGENQVENKSASLAGAGSSATIATVDGTDLTITTPSTWTGVDKTGTVTSVATGAGLTGGTITGSGTIKVKLKDETANTADSSKSTSGDGGLYAVEVDKSGNLAVRVPWTDHTYTVNNGTLSLQANGTTKTTFTANQSGNSTFNIATGSANGTIAVAGVDVSVKGLGSNAYTSTSYLPLSGGTLTGNVAFSGDNDITWSRNTDYARIHFKNTGDEDSDSYLGFETADNGNEYFRFGHTSGTYTEWMSIKSDGVRVQGTKVSLEGHTHPYLPLSGGTMSGSIVPNSNSTIDFGSATAKWHYVYAHRILNVQSICNSTTYSENMLTLPSKSGTIAVTSDLNSYLPLSGGTMTGLLTTTSASSDAGVKVGDTYINAINGDLIFQNNSAIRFGGNDWDYNVWAGLKYAHSSKVIYLGLADGSVFTANSAQSGGKVYTPGVSDIYIGNGTYKVWHEGNLTPSNYASSGHTHDGRYIRWGGSTADVGEMGWGTLTASNGYTILSHAASSDGGDWGMVSKSGQIFMQLDGYYYQNEGQYRVLDTSDSSSFASASHTHTTSIAASSAANQLTLAYGTKYAITAGGTSFVFTMPSSDDTNTWRPIQVGGTDKLTDSSTKLNFASSGSASVSYSSGTITIGCSAAANATADSALTAAEVEALLI